MDKNENKKINFSVAIITFNEEANIRDCIESVHNFADEIVLLDSMSTDKTIEIAKAYAKVKIFFPRSLKVILSKKMMRFLCVRVIGFYRSMQMKEPRLN